MSLHRDDVQYFLFANLPQLCGEDIDHVIDARLVAFRHVDEDGVEQEFDPEYGDEPRALASDQFADLFADFELLFRDVHGGLLMRCLAGLDDLARLFQQVGEDVYHLAHLFHVAVLYGGEDDIQQKLKHPTGRRIWCPGPLTGRRPGPAGLMDPGGID